jgi:hypothetical protein
MLSCPHERWLQGHRSSRKAISTPPTGLWSGPTTLGNELGLLCAKGQRVLLDPTTRSDMHSGLTPSSRCPQRPILTLSARAHLKTRTTCSDVPPLGAAMGPSVVRTGAADHCETHRRGTLGTALLSQNDYPHREHHRSLGYLEGPESHSLQHRPPGRREHRPTPARSPHTPVLQGNEQARC